MANYTNVMPDDHVVIMLISNPKETSKGDVAFVVSNDSNGITTVVLKNGDKGIVLRTYDPNNPIKQRIMTEDQRTENKETFYESIMFSKVIPQTVQSFLNSEGGCLYIGIRDSGTLKERLKGIKIEFEQIEDYQTMKNDKLCDELERRILDKLEKYLTSDVRIGSLVGINFPIVDGVQIIEINIKPSPKPWFYENYFYIRRGGSKLPLSTHKDFYKYMQERFINQ